jgi:uncharacterized RmlC-like cupin family protein
MTPVSPASPSPTCTLIRAGHAYDGKQGPSYVGGVSAESAGAKGLWLGRIEIAPGGRTRAHFHEHHETAIHVLSGIAEMWHGDRLQHHMVATAGDYIYIPAGVPHVAANTSDVDPVIAIIARTDPNEQESVVLRPDLDALVPIR